MTLTQAIAEGRRFGARAGRRLGRRIERLTGRSMPSIQTLLEWAARLGYGARGFVYFNVGLVALLAAIDVTGDSLGAGGIIELTAEPPFGRVWLTLLGAGLGMFVLWRFLQGLGASAGSVLSRAIVLDRWRGEQASRALSWMAIVTFLSPVFAPVIGGQIASLGSWPTIFWVHAAAGAACLAVALAAVPSTARDPSTRLLQRIAAYGAILRDREAVGYIACMGLGFVGVVPLITNSSWVFQDYFGLTPFQFGLCFSLMMLGGSAGAYMNSRIVARAGISKLIGLGTASMGVAGAAVVVATLLDAGIAGILIPGVLYMFGVGFTFANALARTMSRFPHAMGAASAVFGVNQFLIGGLVAAALSSLREPSPLPLALVTGAAGGACAALWWGWLRHKADRPAAARRAATP